MTMAGIATGQQYPSDITDEEWAMIEPLIPVKTGTGTGPGKPRTLNMRKVVNALFYLERTGCQWRYLPKDFPNYNSVRYYYDSWRKDGTWDRIQSTLPTQRSERDGLAREVGFTLSSNQNGKPNNATDGAAPRSRIEPHGNNRRYIARQKS